MELNFTESKTEWVKFGQVQHLCFVGREHLCFAGGCHMLLVHVPTRKEILYEATDFERGQGVACIAGLRSSPVFAFAEKGSRANVLVMTCPDFKRISTLIEGTEDGYINMVFTEAEFLITLTGLPSYAIVLWNWRTGEKVAAKESEMLVNHQMLKSSFGSLVFLAQLGVLTNRLNVWEIMMCGKRCLMIPHEVPATEDPVPFTTVQWTSDGALFVLNQLGDIYMLNAEYNLDLIFASGATGDNPTYFSWYKAGLTITGPDGVINHYKKSEFWTSDWTVKPSTPMVRLLTNERDLLVGITIAKDVLVFNPTELTFENIKLHESKFDGFCLIYPTGEYIVTLAHNEELAAWKVSTGAMVDNVILESYALCIKENPEYPYFAVGFLGGLLQLFSFYEDERIKLLTTFHLTHNPMTDVQFFELGKLLVVADLTCGLFFFIEGVPGAKMHVLTMVFAGRQIADYILVASKTCMRLFVIPVTSTKFVAGNKIMRFCVIRNKPCPEVKEFELENPNVFYTKLYTSTKPNRDRVFYAVPIESKSLHELETKRGDHCARLIGRIESGHHMRKILFHFDKHHTISFAYDGIVIIRSKHFKYQNLIMPHHRMDGGIIKAYVDPLGKYVISMGRNNVLVCTNLTPVEVDKGKKMELHDILKSSTVEYMFTHPTIGFLPTISDQYRGKTWLEVQEILKFESDRRKCEVERESILAELDEIKQQVQELLTRNLEGPENELLDVQEFNLDSELKEELIHASHLECKRTKKHLEALIVARNKVYQWIKEFCWDPMQTSGKTLFGIFGMYEVENFVLLPPDVKQQEVLKYIVEQRQIEEMMANDEIFQPWIPKTQSQIQLQLTMPPKIEQVQKKSAPQEEDEDAEKQVSDDSETVTAFAGSVKHHFIKPEPGHYDQFEIQTALQTEYQTILSKVENIKLKEYFNTEFESLKSLKVREIFNLAEKNARLRHIVSEINYFSDEKMTVRIEDPVWEQKENPELILKVADNEVSITPYISPSQQAILDAEAAERERLRLLRLLDDFKERALMAMMNGVLEVRWEDELKKDVPVPKCLTEKKPEEYREDDLRAIRDYEAQVKFLQSEREKYKRMLTAEYQNLGGTVRESVKKFNLRLQDLLVLRIKVESAVCQENLKVCRYRLRMLKGMELNELEKEAQKAIALNEKKVEEMQKLISSLHENVQECRGHLEAIQAKDKLLDKAFRKDFQETSPSCQEVALRFYKKRPKTNVRGITSLSVLLELSRCVVTREKALILTQDALDFLKAMDHLDQYVGVPNAVDENTYALLCKHRRLKIECEIKAKAAGIQIAECEQTIATLHKAHVSRKERNQEMTSNLEQIRANKLKEAHDIQIQLVMKGGLVEMATTGEIGDFEDAILISRKDVEEMNKVILKAGDKKLKAMRDNMNFRRGILEMEWQHKKMKMIIRDRLDYIADIRSFKVTKETQEYMKSRARGEAGERQLTFEQEVDIVKQSYMRIIDERKHVVADLESRIAGVSMENRVLDKKIQNVNVDVCAQNLEVDPGVDEKEKRVLKLRTATLLKRASLVRQIQENHNMILMLQTELEILRLKTYPTLKYKIIT